MDKDTLEGALQQLESGAAFQIGASIERPGWRLSVGGVEICTLTEPEKENIMKPLANYSTADEELKKAMLIQTQHNVKAFVRSLLEYVSSNPIERSNAIDYLVAEKIMNWTIVSEKFSCGCGCYKTLNGNLFFISRLSARPCVTHQNWSPSTNLHDIQSSLMEKLFEAKGGNQIAIINVQASYKQNEGMKTKVTFRNAGRTDTFDVLVEEQLIPPTAVCLAALRQAGVDVDIK